MVLDAARSRKLPISAIPGTSNQSFDHRRSIPTWYMFSGRPLWKTFFHAWNFFSMYGKKFHAWKKQMEVFNDSRPQMIKMPPAALAKA